MNEHKIIDGDGHVVEDIASIVKYMPEEYVGRSFSEARGKNPFPPIDHLHTANRHFTPKGAFANVGREGWELFLEDVGIGTTVLYTSAGLAFGKIVSRDWAIELARAYNNWMHDTYLSKSPRFKADSERMVSRRKGCSSPRNQCPIGTPNPILRRVRFSAGNNCFSIFFNKYFVVSPRNLYFSGKLAANSITW